MWSSASMKFVDSTVPVIYKKRVIIIKIMRCLSEAMDYLKDGQRRKNPKFFPFKTRLDSLFDILQCKCNIKTCDEENCSGCPQAGHLECSCNSSLPVSEVGFIRYFYTVSIISLVA